VTELEAAIITAYQANGTLNAIAGPYADRAKDAAAVPYIVVGQNPAPQQPMEFFDATAREWWDFAFTYFGTDKATAKSVQAAMRTTFRRVRLSLSANAHATTYLIRESVRDAGWTSNGATVYRADSLFRFVTDR
jgi:hypothetical protein